MNQKFALIILIVGILLVSGCVQDEFYSAPGSTIEGIASCSMDEIGKCQETGITQIKTDTDVLIIENPEKTAGLNHGDKIRVTGIIKEKVGEKIITIDTIEVITPR